MTPVQWVHPLFLAALPGTYYSVPTIDDTRTQILHQLGEGSATDAAESLGGNPRKPEKSESCTKASLR